MESKTGILATKNGGFKLENPFAFKVGQLFTGFGFGCGVGIGRGSPLNLGAIPVLSEVMVATRGASDAFNGIGGRVNHSLRKFGVKNVQVGVGCGVGFGHGFGIGLAIKPGAIHQIQSCLLEAAVKLVTKFGMKPNMITAQGILPAPVQSSITKITASSNHGPLGSITELAKTATNNASQDEYNKFSSKSPLSTSYESRTEKVISNFLQNPLLEDGGLKTDNLAQRLQSENNLLQMVLKHQQVIEELREENEKLRQILVDDLKVPPSKLITSNNSNRNISPCAECFECRRKQRKNRLK